MCMFEIKQLLTVHWSLYKYLFLEVEIVQFAY